MLGADIILTQLNSSSGSWTATDMWAEGFYRPTVDTQQDAKLVSATRSNNQTAVSVKRPLVSGSERTSCHDKRLPLVAAGGHVDFGPAIALQG